MRFILEAFIGFGYRDQNCLIRTISRQEHLMYTLIYSFHASHVTKNSHANQYLTYKIKSCFLSVALSCVSSLISLIVSTMRADFINKSRYDKFLQLADICIHFPNKLEQVKKLYCYCFSVKYLGVQLCLLATTSVSRLS